MRFSWFLLFLVVLAMFSLATFAQSSEHYVPNQIIVKVKENIDVSEIAEPASMQKISSIEQLSNDENIYVVNITGDIKKTIEEYKKDPLVEYAEPNYIAQIAEITIGSISNVPNDPLYSSQYHHANIQNNLSWNLTIGNRNIIIAVIDTGVQWDHPDLSANIWNNTAENCTNGIDDDGNGKIDDCRGWDFVNNDSNPMDDHGHGTHVAGLAAAVGNNSINVTGVCWNCTIMPIKAADSSGFLSYTDISDSLHYAADNGAKVISMSFTGLNASSLQDAIKYAYSKGVVLVAAAGNSNVNSGNIYPAAYDEVVAVGSTTSSDAKSNFSNYGSWVDVSSPGSSILSTFPTNTTGTLSGTSMSTPIVSGIAGLILSKNSSFTQEQVKTLLKSTVDSLTSSVYIGTGRVNSFKAVSRNSSLVVNFKSEIYDKTLTGNVIINGTVNGTYFVNSSLYYGSGTYPSSFILINTNTTNVTNNSITQWNTASLTDGSYTLKLEGNDSFNQSFFDITFVTLDNIPKVTIFSPVNGSTYTSVNVSLNYTVSDSSVDKCRYILDGNETIISSCANTTLINLTDGLHNLTFYANDTGNKTNTTTIQFMTDTAFPQLTITSPSNNSWSNSKNVTINYTVSDANIQACRYNFNLTNTSLSNCANFTLVNITDGFYNVTVYVNDSANNTNSSILFFNVDTTFPFLSVQSPVNNTFYINSNLSLNYTANDTNLNSCKYSINTTEVLFQNCTTNSSVILGDGLYNITIYSNDSAGNTNSSTASITIDTTPPNISSSLFPTNLIAGENITIAINVSDYLNLSNISAIWLNISNTTVNVNITNSTYMSTNVLFNTTNLTVGTQNLSVYANDTLNHISSKNSTFQISLGRNLTINILDKSGLATNASASILYSGQTIVKDNKTNESSLSFIVASDLWDLKLLNLKFNTTLRNINLSSSNISANTSIDDVPESSVSKTTILSTARTLVEIFALNTSINFTNSTIDSYYNSSGINDNYTSVFVCHLWSIANRACSGSWTNITANSSIDRTLKKFSINTTSFSSFALVESSYCGDTTCDSSESCSSCSTDCGPCATTSSSSSSGGGGGGGGGGSTSVSNKTSYFIDKITSGVVSKIKNSINNSGLNSIEITTNTNVLSVDIGLEKLNTDPVSSVPEGSVYRYLSVTHSIAESKFISVRFNFSLEKSWIELNNIDTSKIYLQRYETDHWTKYAATQTSDNNTYITYQADVPGLSNFAISGDQKQVQTVQQQIECTEGKRCYNSEIQSCFDNKWAVEKECQYGCEETSYNGTTYYGCKAKPIVGGIAENIAQNCIEGEIRCNLNHTEICKNNQWTIGETCERGCNGNKCASLQKDIDMNYITIGLAILIATILAFVYYKTRKHGNKQHHKIDHIKHKLEHNKIHDYLQDDKQKTKKKKS
ncbi:MAG: S8 family serine peptidase [Candidatus Aenigmarchaeota archaeon]|nr:S8 family serine peptidase [Candidatus Aenigmarchaeota archaeon]